MSEDDAIAWIRERYGVEQVDRLAVFASMLIEENGNQNLIAASTLPSLWNRHFVDSAQLAAAAPDEGGWFDVGTGPGLPGLVIAIVTARPVVLIEPRRRRVDFLHRCIEKLALYHTTVLAERVEAATGAAAVISARAVASVEKLLAMAGHLSSSGTTWVLPRGQVTAEDHDALKRRRMTFHVERSRSDPGSQIVIAKGRPA